MPTKREPLRSVTYRKELRAVANGDDTGPHPIPTDEQIEAVLGDLPDHGEVAEAVVDSPEAAPVEGEATA